MRYTFMAQHLDSYRLPALCEALQVSRSGFYRWKGVKHEVCAVDKAVSTAFAHHKARAGAPCLTADVRATGVLVSERTVGRSLTSLASDANTSVSSDPRRTQSTVSQLPLICWIGNSR